MGEAAKGTAQHDLATAILNGDERAKVLALARFPASARAGAMTRAHSEALFVNKLKNEHPVLPIDGAARLEIVKNTANSVGLDIEHAMAAARHHLGARFD